MWVYEALLGVETLERMVSTAEVNGVQYDSRKVRAGDVFVAMAGGTTNGNQYIDAALSKGAAAIVTDSDEAWRSRSKYAGKPFYRVANGRRALAMIAANLLGHPERALKVSAVTGTNGKTTTAYVLEQMLRSVGRECVLLGTIETHVGQEIRPSEHTTPEASDLLRIFADGVAAGATEVTMEMSSHALDQERVYGIHVDVAVFTNLTQDHLDYHGTMERYGEAKAKLFAGVGTAPPRVAVVNADDPFCERLQLRSEVRSYGIKHGDYRAEDLVFASDKTSYKWRTPMGSVEIHSPLIGTVNVYNVLAASCAAAARGLSLEEVAEAVKSLKQVPGRLQIVPGSERCGFLVVVDYAHTDDALLNLLVLARDLVRSAGGSVITVFGCGGDRDRTKRAKMGRVAGQGSDLVIVTSDNPRTEDPQAIVNEIQTGLEGTPARRISVLDRAEAIGVAIGLAKWDDIVVIAGKGHEKVQILKDGTVPFDDVEVAARSLRSMKIQEEMR